MLVADAERSRYLVEYYRNRQFRRKDHLYEVL